MEKGAHTDIQSNRPVSEVVSDRENEEKKKLEQKAKLASLSKTEAGALLISMIETSLMARIKEFIEYDPESKTLNAMLIKIGAKEVSGKDAVDKLTSRYFKSDK